ncbi:hypothetical protein AVEN_142273-1 [Araneus ventricosus]|uniref:Uncharacterized protein n=1 Tax=Araneus ventricosus TaxID=182803 RepID=A0A4Y2GKU6_ARAVE|nr:hypothetical protein AVEN_142273-1 [Araneus ventricosus]
MLRDTVRLLSSTLCYSAPCPCLRELAKQSYYLATVTAILTGSTSSRPPTLPPFTPGHAMSKQSGARSKHPLQHPLHPFQHSRIQTLINKINYKNRIAMGLDFAPANTDGMGLELAHKILESQFRFSLFTANDAFILPYRVPLDPDCHQRQLK